MNENCDSQLPLQEREASDLLAPLGSGQQVKSTAGPSHSFANVQMRPEGHRYGDADLVPGGSLSGSGGMMMNERNFRGPGMPHTLPSVLGGNQPALGSADAYARFDPMFPGQVPPGRDRGDFGVGAGGGRWGQSAPLLPGEPNNDLFLPPQGRPGEPFGGPGGGQFGPGQVGGSRGWGGGSPWA